ncbi:hypothetical protein [Bacillus infantis]|uniref:Lipoprotein n=1 Tax=Bacillus infantis TaxID=324767 RepID=A0A5D4RJT1_9BACI|nr:hypothetical protein [Bacillus infantis]TYS50074.1 hypothetical protein FZD51_05835 [Bacillus infantis]
MKIRKLHILFFLVLLTGCQETNVQPPGSELNEMTGLKKELAALNEKDNVHFKEISEDYRLSLKIFREEGDAEDRIYYDVMIDKPKDVMRDVTVTGILDDSMSEFVMADSLGFSNVDAIDDNSRENYTLEPEDSKIKGIATSRGFILNENPVNKTTFNNILSDIKLKISWKDKSNKTHTDYLKPNSSIIEVDPSLITYYNN